MKLAIQARGSAQAFACGLALLFATATTQSATGDKDIGVAQDRNSALLEKANDAGTVRVIVLFKDDAATRDLVATAGRGAALANVQEGVVGRLMSAADIDRESVKAFDIVPGMALAVDAVALRVLLDDPAVSAVYEDVAVPPTLFASIPLIDANDAWATGHSGAGQTVAILDTGVNKTHPFLAGKVVSEACYSTNSGSTVTSLCPGGVTSSTAAGSALDCSLTISGCGHGTHVAGIAAGTNGASTSGTMHGVARDAKVIAIKVFSRFSTSAQCAPSAAPCVRSYSSDQIKGLERVHALRNTYAVAAANMSLGGGQYFSTCDSNPLKPIIDTLRGVGIATVIASGNNGYHNSTGAPGCISTAITVGSTDKSDVESSFSNAASWLDLLAPGSNICSSVIGSPNCGGAGSIGYGFKGGTSMATPHVTGAWAVMKSKNGTASVSAVETALESTGKLISVGTVGTKPRIDLDNALAALAPGLNLGLNWDHCQQTHRALGASVTWCYLEANQMWVAINDDEGEKSLIKATAKNHWVGVNVSSISGTSFTINAVRVYKN